MVLWPIRARVLFELFYKNRFLKVAEAAGVHSVKITMQYVHLGTAKVELGLPRTRKVGKKQNTRIGKQ